MSHAQGPQDEVHHGRHELLNHILGLFETNGVAEINLNITNNSFLSCLPLFGQTDSPAQPQTNSNVLIPLAFTAFKGRKKKEAESCHWGATLSKGSYWYQK